MAKLFDVLRVLNELDTAEIEAKIECKGRLGRVNDIAEMNSRKAGDVIGMAAPKGTLMKLQSMFGQPTHAAILFLVDRKEFDKVDKELDALREACPVQISQDEYSLLTEKASNWDSLGDKMEEFYGGDGDDWNPGFDEIGEAAAQAFGYL